MVPIRRNKVDFMFIVLIAAAVLLVSGLRICQEYEKSVVFRLGRLVGTRGPGLYYLIPLLEWQSKLDLRVVTVNIEQQETITRDSVTVKVNAVLWYRIMDPLRATVEVQSYMSATYAIALTGLRNIIGQHSLDEVLKERDKINVQLKSIVEETTKKWGISIENVEMKDVEIPEQMQRVMAQEAEAIREKRARIVKAEAEMEAAAKLVEASQMIAASPMALELRRMQMLTEVGQANSTTTIIMMPSEFVAAAKTFADKFN
jgi:regulator of protease activity HflC (stomatin/prohibitin superfamily)